MVLAVVLELVFLGQMVSQEQMEPVLMVFLVLKDQEAQPLQCEILTEIGMADGILLILLNDLLTVV